MQKRFIYNFPGKIFFLICFLQFYACNNEKGGNYSELLEREISTAKPGEFRELYFVANYSGHPSIYRFDADRNESAVIWNDRQERVIDLLISENRQTAFFITKRKQRLRSSQPAIERGKLYHLDMNLNKAELITRLEEGIQIIPFWLDNDRFTLIINSIDKTIASYINKNTQVYNRFGKLLSDNNEIFDITKDGYPVTKFPDLKYRSPNELFAVFEKSDSIFISNSKNEEMINTGLAGKNIRKIGWAENNRHLILLLTDRAKSKGGSDKNESLLAVFDLLKKKTVVAFDGTGFRRFVLIGDFLIFDNGFGKDSFIKIFSLDSLKELNSIKIQGGCGLRNIPGT